MSVRVMAAVWQLDLPWMEKYVLVALADHADHEGEDIWPGRDYLLSKTGLSRNSLLRSLASLKLRGLVEIVELGNRGRRTTYRIIMERVLSQGTLFAQRVPSVDTKGALRGHERVPSQGTPSVLNRHRTVLEERVPPQGTLSCAHRNTAILGDFRLCLACRAELPMSG